MASSNLSRATAAGGGRGGNSVERLLYKALRALTEQVGHDFSCDEAPAFVIEGLLDRHVEQPGNSRHSTLLSRVKGSVLTHEPPARAGRQQGVCRAAGVLLLNST